MMSERNQEIIRLRRSGETFVTIARRYGITPTRIAQIVHKYARIYYREHGKPDTQLRLRGWFWGREDIKAKGEAVS